MRMQLKIYGLTEVSKKRLLAFFLKGERVGWCSLTEGKIEL